MAAVRVAINGFGRIGRLVFRAAMGNPDIEIVGVNDLTDTHTLAHLLKYDSVHDTLKETVAHKAGAIVVSGREIPVSAERDPANLPWKAVDAQIVVESTGRFTKRSDAAKHLEAGAKKVIISAPSKDADVTIVLGVNQEKYDPANHHVVSNASCTTNCLAPMVKVLDEAFGLSHGVMTTIHSYTNDQPILDFVHTDLRRARAGALSMIPTTTGAAVAIGLVMPHLKGKLDGLSIRVPTPNVSLVDLTSHMKKSTTVKEVKDALRAAAEGPLKGILGYTDEPLVSRDFNHCPLSSFIDGDSTYVVEGTMVKTLSWYDNEWGYSNRVVDLAQLMGKSL